MFVKEIIILSELGIPLFYYNFNKRSNDQVSFLLEACYFDQFYKFSRNGFKDNLVCLELSKSRIYFYSHPDSKIYLILRVKNKIKRERKFRNILKKVSLKILNDFSNNFKNCLKDFDGDISRFKCFSYHLENLVSKWKYLKKD